MRQLRRILLTGFLCLLALLAGSVVYLRTYSVPLAAVPRPLISAVQWAGGAITLPIRKDLDTTRRVGRVKPPFVEGQLLVQLQSGTTAVQRDQLIALLGGKLLETFQDRDGLFLIELGRGLSVTEGVRLLKASAGVEHTGPNHLYYLDALPNDMFFRDQWGLHTGSSTDPKDPDLDAVEVWDTYTGSDTAVIGVVDSGVDYRHIDLAGNMWVNSQEISGNALDDDRNGYVDDVHGIDAIDRTGDPLDDEGHGTHVAGTIGAVGNNGLGVSGVAWTTRIAACRFLDRSGAGTEADAIRCFDYFSALKARGVNVVAINASWGSERNSVPLSDAIDRLRQRGVVVVAAAGNDGVNTDQRPHYPSAYPLSNIVSVGSIGRGGQLSSFSNTGALSVDLFAPGEEILSTRPGDALAIQSGTSMATPHVTGMIGLLASEDSTLTANNLISHVIATVTPVDALRARSVSGGIAHLQLPDRDRDADGMDDRWERRYGLNPVDGTDGTRDPDGDGLDNLREFRAGTSPISADTDSDGLSDRREIVDLGSNPLLADTDGDGLTDLRETEIGTRPIDADSDDDGLSDGDELASPDSDPLRADTDGDGMGDGFERRHRLNPRDGADATQDIDGDGLDNRAEAGAGTNPRSRDSDADDLSDFDELRNYSTQPMNPDSDADGMGDGWEVRYAFNPLSASDGSQDADGDGALNREEFAAGSDPRDAGSRPPSRPWSGLLGNAARTGHVPVATPGGMVEQRWSRAADNSVTGESVTIGGGLVLDVRSFAPSAGVIARSLLDGSEQWRYEHPDSVMAVQPVISRNRIIAAFKNSFGGFSLVGFDLAGKVEYVRNLGQIDSAEYNSRLMVIDNQGFFSAGTSLIAFTASTGVQEWRQEVPSASTFLQPRWVAAASRNQVGVFSNQTLHLYGRANGALQTQIGYSDCGRGEDSTVFFDAVGEPYLHLPGCIARFDVANRRVRWVRTDVAQAFRPTVAGETIIAEQQGYAIVGINTADGSNRWTWDSGSYINAEPVSSSTHFFVSESGRTLAMAFADRSISWQLPQAGQMAFSDDGVFVLRDSLGLSLFNLDGDLDGDGLPDWWERAFRLSVTNPADAGADADADGLSNLDEFRARSHPRNADTDGDGADDGAERSAGTNPVEPDTDGDGLRDGAEINQYRSNPVLTDSDSDQVSDGEEVNRHRTDPNDSASKPDFIFSANHSFETELPSDWRNDPSSGGNWRRSTSQASDGQYALEAMQTPGRIGVRIEWRGRFAKGELVFDLLLPNTISSFVITANDSERILYVPGGTAGWQTFRVAIREGVTSISFEAADGSPAEGRPAGFLDNIRFRKPVPFGLSGDNLIVRANGMLHEYTADGRAVRAPVPQPEGTSSTSVATTTRHEVVVRDYRVWHFYNPINDSWRKVDDQVADVFGSPVATPDSLLMAGRGGRIVRYDLNGQFRQLAGDPGTTAHVTYGADGYVYTNDYFGVVRRYDPVRYQLQAEISLGIDFRGPLAVDADGRILVRHQSGISRFDSTGQPLAEVSENSTIGAEHLLIDLRQRIILPSSASFSVVAKDLSSSRNVTLDNGLPSWALIGVTQFLRGGADTDLDGCADWWELSYGLLPFQRADGAADPDADGLPNSGECAAGANPRVADSDGDGLTDRDEVTLGSNPAETDSDDDGLSDSDERSRGTSPVRADTDADGLTDPDEINRTGTNPINADTDRDGMPDGFEEREGLNPRDPADGARDTDGDGLVTSEEFRRGTSFRLADTDRDGLADGEELRRGTGPLQRDTDADLLPDGFEVANGFNPLLADDANLDSDGDGFSNLVEARYTANPRTGTSTPRPGAWTGEQGDATHRGFAPVRIDTSRLARRWVLRPDGQSEERLNPMAVGHGKLYATYYPSSSGIGSIVALNAVTGQRLWRNQVADATALGPPSLNRLRIAVAAALPGNVSAVLAIDGATGSTRWQTESFGTADQLMPMAVDAPWVVGRLGNSNPFGAIDEATGRNLWFTTIRPSSGTSAIVNADRVILFSEPGANRPSGLTVLDAASGTQRQFISDARNEGFAATPILGFEDDVFVVRQQSLKSIDLGASRIRWRTAGSFATLSPALGAGMVFAIESGALVAFDERTGLEIWRFRGTGEFVFAPVATAAHVLVSDLFALYVIDIRTGRRVWSDSEPGAISIGDNKMIYIAGPRGILSAYAWFNDLDLDGEADDEDLDRDGDGMLNDWEIQNGFNPANSSDGVGDADNDGLSNFREHGLQTRPRQIDSDGDGVRDDVEVSQGFDPLDASCRSIECVMVRDSFSLPVLKRARQVQGG